MRWFLVFAVVLVAVIVAALQFTHRPVLWNVTEPGMTVDEVRRALRKRCRRRSRSGSRTDWN